jgi:hypothetical protein
MTTRREIHLTLPICRVGFQHRTRRKEEHWKNSGMYRLLQFK